MTSIASSDSKNPSTVPHAYRQPTQSLAIYVLTTLHPSADPSHGSTKALAGLEMTLHPKSIGGLTPFVPPHHIEAFDIPPTSTSYLLTVSSSTCHQIRSFARHHSYTAPSGQATPDPLRRLTQSREYSSSPFLMSLHTLLGFPIMVAVSGHLRVPAPCCC